MAVRRILLIGDPLLWRKCVPIRSLGAPATRQTVRDLRDTLADFRSRHGFGRGIAAPQIGALKRIIYVYFPQEGIDGAFINPRIMRESREKIRIWDDCFSFPDLLVRVERSKAIEVEFMNEKGEQSRIKAEGALSELLQHEIDHLDGVLAVERAVDRTSFALRDELKRRVKKGYNQGGSLPTRHAGRERVR